jgi:hypothetical protein
MKLFLYLSLLVVVLSKTIPASNVNFSYTGRMIHSSQPDMKRFAWPGVYVKIRFTGPCLTLIINDIGGRNGWNAIVDGRQTVLFTRQGLHQYPISCALGAGWHDLWLFKRTEQILGTAEFHGIVINDDASVSSPGPKPTRRIEYYGDSFTAGFGNEGLNTTCPFTKETENALLTYAGMIATSVNAEFQIQAYSGLGMVRNYGDANSTSSAPFPIYFDRIIPSNANALYDFSFKPHATVIFLGINDYSTRPWPSEAQFKSGYVRMLNRVYSSIGDTQVFTVCYKTGVSDPKCGYTQELAASYPNKKIHFILLNGILKFPQHFGCVGHPNVAGHREVAKVIEPVIRTVMNWK